MRTERGIRHLASPILWATLAALLGCAEAPPRPAAAATDAARHIDVTAKTVAELEEQVASLEKYAAQMERTYAAQEAEILSLQREIAGRASCPAPLSPAAQLASSAAALTARPSASF
jgi:hypothetical protein